MKSTSSCRKEIAANTAGMGNGGRRISDTAAQARCGFRPARLMRLAVAVILSAASLAAQAAVTLANTSQTTTLTANVSEQAKVTVPAGVTFNVTNITASTAASAASVTAENIVLATASKQLKISVQANAASFTPPVTGATTWDASAVTWNAATWTGGTGATGTLSNTAYTEVVTCTADTADCRTTGLVFTLANKNQVKRSGNHTLVITWKFEAIGT